MFRIYDGRTSFYQYDLNRKLIVEDKTITKVHFCNRTGSCSIIRCAYEVNGMWLVDVPNVILQESFRVNVYGFDKEYTKHSAVFNIVPRSKPEDYIYTDEEIKVWDELEQRVEELEETVIELKENSGNTNSIDKKEKPLIFIDGEIPTTKDNVLAEMRIMSSWLNLHAYIKIKCQGSSSMNYPKKNFTITLFEDEAREIPLYITIPGWKYPSNKYVLKANWIDATHARNIIAARLWGEVVASRADYDTLPDEYKNSPNNGAVDGFPICVYTNGSYQGLYTWNIGKDAWLWGMNEENPNHILLCAETNTNNDILDTPCNFRALWNGIDGSNWSVEVGENSESLKNSLNELITCVKDTDDETFIKNIGEYINIQSVIDYWLFQYVICGLDGLAKNMLLGCYDGKMRYMGAYDLDSTFGLWWNGASFVSSNYRCPADYQEKRNLLFERINALYKEEVKARYIELRKTVYSYSNIVSKFEEFIGAIGSEAYKDNITAYNNIPSAETNNIWQLRNYIRDRLEYCDIQILRDETLITFVESIESNGNAWIDTGIKPDNDMLIDITYLNPENEIVNENIFGAHVDDIILRCVGSTGGHYITWRINGKDNTSQISADGRMPNGSKQTLKLDTSVVDNIAAKANIHLFTALHNNNEAWVPGTLKIYAFKITKKSTNETILNLIPSIDANEIACMYDTVSENILYNSGTGTLVANRGE